ncbi:MAG TPA: FAD-dependent oxidoreductase [Bacteroidales bacterium]|nr:FAD-dependent oxidoreductase [Bacteroidales bacterium]
MIKEADFVFYPEELFNEEYVLQTLSDKFNIPKEVIKSFRIIRKSIDARKKVKYNVRIQCISLSEVFPELTSEFDFRDVSKSKSVIIVGAGPAGYFAALNCLLTGFKPIVIERGKSVEERKHDISKINRGLNLNPESNFAFGEGGAGTYSDGKLYTRSKKRGDIYKILQLLHYFGADDDILINSHPHIGTDKLPGIMKKIREKIVSSGGEIHFNSKVTKLIIEKDNIKGIECEDGKLYSSDFVILATGHSARDVYYFLENQKVMISEKGFAMGIRVEHPQTLIDSIQYKRKERGEFLPPASYNLVKQIDNRGVYSFCMCPGGTIVCSATEKNQIVVNGMSNSRRNSLYANSGIVVELQPEDFLTYSKNKVFSGLEFQKQIEDMAFVNSASGLQAPAQRLSDFVSEKISQDIPESSYHPGLISSPLHFWLPEIISQKLQKAFKEFDKQMRGFITNQAIVVGVESRTSSPIKVLRDPTTFQSVNIKGLYPCGEGAGYAGGIVSSAIDGMMAVNKINEIIKH